MKHFETAYTSVDMSTKLGPNNVVVLVTDLHTGATFHHVWNSTLLPKPLALTDKQRWDIGSNITHLYASAQLLDEVGEKQTIHEVETTLMVQYVQTSRAWKNMISMGHNSIHIAIDYIPNQSDFAIRFLGTSNADTVSNAILNNQQSMIMAMGMNFFKKSNSNWRTGITMIDVETPGSRTYPKRGTVGSNFTPKKKKRK